MSSDKCLGVLVIIFIGISASLAMPGLPCEEGVQIGHHFDCAWLWQCWEGDWWDLPCPEGQLFDTPTGFCVDFDEATCRPGTHPNEPPIDPPPSDGICPPNGIIFLPSEADCNEYFLCINGDKHPRNCRSDMHWNPEKDVCDYPYRAGCDADATPPSGSNECIPGFVGQLPYRGNCNRFIHCNNGNRSIQQCPHLHHFDVHQRRCVFKLQATCYRDE